MPSHHGGIGDTGTPALHELALSSEGNSLIVSGGSTRVLTRATFTAGSIVGAWRATPTQGLAFAYFFVFPDNTFLYAEDDLTAQTASENGLETGTYTYDGTYINPVLVFDDNLYPGGESGIGTIGISKPLDVTLSNNTNTLTAAGGNLALTRVF
jgi:hypothetical protein